MGKVRIGISGWRYAPWRGKFYPRELPQQRELAFASRCFPSIELNGSFYSLQRPSHYAQWYAATPRGFVFAVKGSRYITHIRRLREIERPLANFFASGLFALKEKLGPLLWQFPPNFRFNAALLEQFFRLLPRTTAAAAGLARRRDRRVSGRALLKIDRSRRLRHAIEVRHPSFVDEAFVRLLRRHRVGLVVADTAGKFPYMEDVTADFLYLRLHGDEKLYVSGYGDAALDGWAARIRAWRGGGQWRKARTVSRSRPPRAAARDVYCYFDNDAKVKAPRDARALMRKLRLEWAA